MAETARSDDERLVAAFPESIRADAMAAVAALPRQAEPQGTLLTSHTLGSYTREVPVRVSGETVEIPVRIYHDSLLPEDVAAGLSPTQRTILGCLYTRHHNGFVRQQWLRAIVLAEQPWVVPFVVQLVGEYVVEIIVDIQQALADLSEPGAARGVQYGRFLAENPAFLELTRQHVASYWAEYYYLRYPRRSDYPGSVLVAAFEAVSN